MSRGYLVRAGFENELVDEFLSHSAVYVGWDKLGDMSGLAPAKIHKLLLSQYPECRTSAGRPSKHYREIVEFTCGVKPGDMIVTPHRATRTFVVGRAAGPYRFEADSEVRSTNGTYRHSIPVTWTHALRRDDISKLALSDTDQRGKTAFWLKPETVRQLEAAPHIPIEGRRGGSSSGAGGQKPSAPKKSSARAQSSRGAVRSIAAPASRASSPTKPSLRSQGCGSCAANAAVAALCLLGLLAAALG